MLARSTRGFQMSEVASEKFERAKLHFSNADRLGGHSMTAWNFNIVGGLAAAGWAITYEGSISGPRAILFAVMLALYFIITGSAGYNFQLSAFQAINSGRRLFGDEVSHEFDYFNPKVVELDWKFIFVLELLAVVSIPLFVYFK